MKVKVVYDDGRGNNYEQYIQAGKVRISQSSKRITVQFKNDGSEKPTGVFTMHHADAERIGRALLLMCSAGDVNPVEFSVGEKQEAAAAA